MRKKRLYVISNMYPSIESPNYGIFVKNFVLNLLKQSNFTIEKIVICGKGKNIFSKLSKYFVFYLKLFYKLVINDVDIYYVHYANHSLLPFLFFQKRAENCVVNFHGGDLFPENIYSRGIQQLTGRIIKKCKRIVVPSVYFKYEVAKKYDIDENLIFISPSGGIDTSLFHPSLPIQIRNNKKIRIGYLGRLDAGKGFELMISFAEHIKKRDIAFSFSVIGGGSLMHNYITQVNKLGLSNNFEFHGMQPHENIPKLLRAMDVFIFPSYRKGESLGLVGLEAMACGIPVIGSDCGGISSYVEYGVNGFLFQPRNLEDLCQKFECFCKLTVAQRTEMVHQAIKTANDYDSNLVNNNIIKYLNGL